MIEVHIRAKIEEEKELAENKGGDSIVKNSCPYCGLKVGGKEIAKHVRQGCLIAERYLCKNEDCIGEVETRRKQRKEIYFTFSKCSICHSDIP